MLGLINQRLSIGVRLAIVGGMFTALAIGISTVNVMRGLDSSDFSQKELRGAHYVEQVWKYVQSARQDQTANASLMTGHEAYDDEFDAQSEANAVLNAADGSTRRNAAIPLLTKIANNSNIDLEPDTPTYDIAHLNAKDLASLLRPLEVIYSQAKMPKSAERSEALKTAVVQFKSHMETVTTGFATIEKYDTSRFASQFKQKAEAFNAETEKLLAAATALANDLDIDFASVSASFEAAYSGLTETAGSEFTGLVSDKVENARTSVFETLGITLAVIIPALLLIVRITLGLTRRFKALDVTMTRLGQGDRSVDIPYLDDTNETGRIAATLARMKQDMIDREKAEAKRKADVELVVTSFSDVLQAIARRDLTYRLDTHLPAEYLGLQEQFNEAISQLDEAMREIRMRADDISSNSVEIHQSSRQMAEHTERQAASLEETSAAVTEVSSTVGQSANSATNASDLALAAKRGAERGNQIASEAIEAMRQIAKSSGEITNIIGVIDEIAFQTNLLALNAGVEAARAGDAGRGFAVVASEVRALAQRSSKAAKEIKVLIQNSETQVGTGVRLVEESGNALQKIVEDVDTITRLVGEIAYSQREQATALNQMGTAVSNMDQATQQNVTIAEQCNTASEALAGYAQEMTTLVANFKVSGTSKRKRAYSAAA